MTATIRKKRAPSVSAWIQIAVLAVLLLLFCALARLVFFRDYTVTLPLQYARDEQLYPVAEDPETVRLGEVSRQGDFLRIPVEPLRAGKTDILIRDESGVDIFLIPLSIGSFKTVYNLSDGSFTGDSAVLIALAVFWLTVSAIMLWHFIRSRGPAFYSYHSIYFAGFGLFALVTGGMMSRVTVAYLTRPDYIMMNTYSTINGASRMFMMVTTPFILAFAVAMAVSNIVLLRHDRLRLRNALGLGVSFFLLAGEGIGWFLFNRDFMGSEMEYRILTTAENVYATAFVYFECMLTGSVICGIRAARHKPAPDKDFIVILGCWFRPDGSLPPLLRGRVDRAIAFWREEKTAGKEAVLIPSGGQGPDEPMPEAEAMHRYLLSQGIPENQILPETASKNTYENMAFSKSIIERTHPEAKTVFATTNYHVFRSGMWAAQAGLEAEGIGGKTKWWYWPNAFMRECAGLLQRRWKQELILLALLAGFFALLSMMLY
ncbi:MAG: YdcF family protein [Clostridia bacterium]|nr:YdcF family protein [Clostridia bacterium]